MDGAEVMLVLSRKLGASIQIGPDIMISVLAVQGSRVRLGISAPADTDIWRAELTEGCAAVDTRPRHARRSTRGAVVKRWD